MVTKDRLSAILYDGFVSITQDKPFRRRKSGFLGVYVESQYLFLPIRLSIKKLLVRE